MTIPIYSAFYANLSSLAYQDHAAISAYLGENGFLPPVFFDKDDTHAFMYVDADTVVLALRGNDLDAIWPEVYSALLLSCQRRVVLTGALASEAADRLKGWNVVGTY